MLIIGISITHDGTICVLKDGVNVFSIAEERLNRIKGYIGFPFLGLDYILKNKIVNPEEVKMISISTSIFKKEYREIFAFQLTKEKSYYDFQNEKKPKNFFINDKSYKKIKNDEQAKLFFENKIKSLFIHHGIDVKIDYVDHHLSHISSAVYTSGFSKTLAFSMDGEGDMRSASVYHYDGEKLNFLSSTDNSNSLGYLYSEVTLRSGFKMSRHEGKITGLAAYGKYDKKNIKKLVKLTNGKILYRSPRTNSILKKFFRRMYRLIGVEFKLPYQKLIDRLGDNLTKEDMAASIQGVFEFYIPKMIEYWMNKTGYNNIVLAGGVFANVRLNQEISEINNLQNMFIYPNMGDGGNAYGASVYSYSKKNNIKPKKMLNAYLGPEFNNSQIKEVLNFTKFETKYSKNHSEEVSDLLSNGKIVGLFQGRMEYGPRALGNRSILADPREKEINKILNERLRRTEFMPFAPCINEEFFDNWFEIHNEKLKFAAEFMTLTFKVKNNKIELVPSIVHLDGTARPQIIRKEINPIYHNIVNEFNKKTGIPILINTSFNLHEEPIVCSPIEAIQALEQNAIDYLYMGDYLISIK